MSLTETSINRRFRMIVKIGMEIKHADHAENKIALKNKHYECWCSWAISNTAFSEALNISS